MKGLAFRKLGRTSSHRDALLRNLVTSLFQHERISTTYAKAKEAQRMAEKMITKAKRSALTQDRSRQLSKVRGYVFARGVTVPSVLQLAQRYIDRPGGYTRLHLHGNRPGDNAPRAVLELVDQPQGDIKLDMTAMAMGRELYLHAQGPDGDAIAQEAFSLGGVPIEHDQRFEPLTRTNVTKLLKFNGDAARPRLEEKARDHFFRLMAMRQLEGDHRVDEERITGLGHVKPRGAGTSTTKSMTGIRRLAGMRRDVLRSGPQEPEPKRPWRRNSVVRITKGVFASRRGSRTVYLPHSIRAAQELDKAFEAPLDKFA